MRDDFKFDLELTNELSQLTPKDLPLEKVTPWQHSMRYILWGLGLTCITLNFWNLQYILPAIGAVCLILGLRSLRQENKFFRVAWILSLVQAAHKFLHLTVNATIWAKELAARTDNPLHGVFLPLNLILSYCFWQGLLAIQKKAGQEHPSATPAGALLVWNIAGGLLALSGANGSLFGIPLLILYILILRSLWKLAHLLDETGYAVRAAPVTLSDRWLALGYLGTLTVCIFLCLLCFAHYPMNWTPVVEDKQTDLEEIRENLLSLGFPENILNDMSSEELALYEGVTALHHDTRPHYATDAENGALTLQSVMVHREDGSWRFLHYFSWAHGPINRNMAYVAIWTLSNGITGEDLEHLGAIRNWNGEVRFDRFGTTYTAPYHRIEPLSYSSATFFGTTQQTATIATFSPPFIGSGLRGYIAYDVEAFGLDYWNLLDSYINYAHPIRTLNYPLSDPVDRVKEEGLFNRQVDIHQHSLKLKASLWN